MIFFEDLLHALVGKLFLHLKEAVLHLHSENQCWTYQFMVTSEIKVIKLRPRRLRPCETMRLKLGQN